MTVYDVQHLNLSHGDELSTEPIIEYEPDNPDGHHVVTLFRGYLRNYWHVDEMPPEVRERLREVEG